MRNIPFGTRFPSHSNDLTTRRSADDGIVDEEHHLIFKFERYGVEFLANRFLAFRLAGHDEGTSNIAILNESLAKLST